MRSEAPRPGAGTRRDAEPRRTAGRGVAGQALVASALLLGLGALAAALGLLPLSDAARPIVAGALALAAIVDGLLAMRLLGER